MTSESAPACRHKPQRPEQARWFQLQSARSLRRQDMRRVVLPYSRDQPPLHEMRVVSFQCFVSVDPDPPFIGNQNHKYCEKAAAEGQNAPHQPLPVRRYLRRVHRGCRWHSVLAPDRDSPVFEAVHGAPATKFDELFGGRLTGRCYTTEQTLHAKTVVPWEKELFIGIGVNNEDFGTERLNIPLPDDAGYVAMMTPDR